MSDTKMIKCILIFNSFSFQLFKCQKYKYMYLFKFIKQYKIPFWFNTGVYFIIKRYLFIIISSEFYFLFCTDINSLAYKVTVVFLILDYYLWLSINCLDLNDYFLP